MFFCLYSMMTSGILLINLYFVVPCDSLVSFQFLKRFAKYWYRTYSIGINSRIVCITDASIFSNH
jgi:hypothetical protein